VCLAAGLLQVAITYARRRLWPRWLNISRRRAQMATAIAVLIALPVAIGAGLPGELGESWESFKSQEGSDAAASSSATIIDFNSSGRYQFWESAAEASATATFTGIGPGAFEFWWSRNGSYAGFVRDAHSLYMESLAELGVTGLALIAGFVLFMLCAGAIRSYTAPRERRLVLAAATASCAAFAFGAALDWIWEIAVLPMAFMLLAAVAVAGFSRRDRGKYRRRKRQKNLNRLQRAAVAVVAVAALGITWHELRGATALEESRIRYANGDLPGALEKARKAKDIQGYAASPRIQEALVLERQERFARAARAAREAAERERTNWRNWLTLARIEARAGRLPQALAAYRRAKELNPRSGQL